VAVAEAGSCSSDSTPSPRTSIYAAGATLKRKEKKKMKWIKQNMVVFRTRWVICSIAFMIKPTAALESKKWMAEDERGNFWSREGSRYQGIKIWIEQKMTLLLK